MSRTDFLSPEPGMPVLLDDLPPKPFSAILQDIAAGPGERISLGDLLGAMQGRAFGALLIVFAFPNILPSPPGLAGVLGLPLIFLSAQMVMGRPPWLPQFIARRSMARSAFATLVERGAPWLARAERLLRERMLGLSSAGAQRLIGLVCLLLSLTLVLPVPFGNMLPSIALCLIALGVLERDGLWIVGGITSAFIAVVIVGGMGYALAQSALFVMRSGF